MGQTISSLWLSDSLSKKSSLTSVITPKNSICTFPLEVQRVIYEFSGVDPVAKTAKDQFIKLLKTGRIGIPEWQTTYTRYETSEYITRRFVIPSYEYYKYCKVFGDNWWFPKASSDPYYDQYYRLEPYHLSIVYKINDFKIHLQKDIYFVPNIEYCVYNEGGFKPPAIPISFRTADDLDILYSLKSARGNSIFEAEQSIKIWGTRAKVLSLHPEKSVNRIIVKWLLISRNGRDSRCSISLSTPPVS